MLERIRETMRSIQITKEVAEPSLFPVILTDKAMVLIL